MTNVEILRDSFSNKYDLDGNMVLDVLKAMDVARKQEANEYLIWVETNFTCIHKKGSEIHCFVPCNPKIADKEYQIEELYNLFLSQYKDKINNGTIPR